MSVISRHFSDPETIQPAVNTTALLALRTGRMGVTLAHMASATRFSTTGSIGRRLLGLLGRNQWIAPEEAAYLRLARKGYRPSAIIDVGAYQGEWTRLAARVFPDSIILMVEAQVGKRRFLERVCKDLPNASYRSALLGSKAGEEVTFFEMETGSSFFPERSNISRVERRLVTESLDVVAAHLAGPVFLKVDVQGTELQVLAAAEETLRKCELVQLEVALLPYNEGAPSMLEVLTYMEQRNFVPLDVCGFSRPNGIDLVQIDVLFARRDSRLRPNFFQF
jgi:FkbM family methyltransferase